MQSLKVAIVGAGAIGSAVAALLLRSGLCTVSMLARGHSLRSLRARGLRARINGAAVESAIHASDRPEELGQQDVVISAVKAYSLADAAPAIAGLAGPDGMVLTIQNGIPWWYLHGLESGRAHALESVDPSGRIWNLVGPERALGAAIALPARKSDEGVVECRGRFSLALGAPRPNDHAAILPELARVFQAAGFMVETPPDIRSAIWSKLCFNISTGPIGVLHGMALGEMAAAPSVMARRRQVYEECRRVAAAWSYDVAAGPEALSRFAAGAETHKSSMLQDFERGAPLETDAIIKAVMELASMKKIEVPAISDLLNDLSSIRREAPAARTPNLPE